MSYTRHALPDYPVHFVGSVKTTSAESTFRRIADSCRDLVKRWPDGEPGPRQNFTVAMVPMLADCEQLESAEPLQLRYPDGRPYYEPLPRWRIRDGAGPDEVMLGSLGYAQAARDSHAVFAELKRDGVIPQEARFQVSLPTPLAFVSLFIDAGSQSAYEPIHEAKMLQEMTEILEVLPHDDLAIQWDVAPELVILEGALPYQLSGDPVVAVSERVGRLLDAIPAGVEAGVHLCYGNATGENLVFPKDTGLLARLAGSIRAATVRPVDWLHVPVPRDRDDSAYFQSIAELDLGDTDLYLGLIHEEDGVEGAARRMSAAREAGIPVFGVATECGFARLSDEDVSTLMRLHGEVGQRVTASASDSG